jgi:hypothetical protein
MTIRLAALALITTLNSYAQKQIKVDICVYGATSAGVIAAYTAKNMNKTVLVVDPGCQCKHR